VITTSWDDGHPLDLRLAALLSKYGVSGTFYVPRHAEKGTMTAAEVRELSKNFEIGAHTLNHTVLTHAPEQQAWPEIAGSKSWVEDVTGQPCVMFCPPQGRYSARHRAMVRKAAYTGLRSVELGSLAHPRLAAGLMLMPTTVQAHPQDVLALARNAIKRLSIANFWRVALHG